MRPTRTDRRPEERDAPDPGRALREPRGEASEVDPDAVETAVDIVVGSVAFVQKLAWSLADAKHDYADAEVAVFPPFTDLRSVQTLIAADSLPLAYGAQDVSAHDSGAYTGEVSGAFLAALDCAYVIIGHSERRTYHHETDAVVNAKVLAAQRHGLVPVVCVGETVEPGVQRILDITGLVPVLPVLRKREEAIRAARTNGAGE